MPDQLLPVNDVFLFTDPPLPASAMAPSLALTAALGRKLESALQVAQIDGKSALQIVPVQLRVWLADQNDVACRPWYIFCAELYPRGKVINQRVHSPASEKPDALALLNFFVDHVLNPPDGEARQRPTHVSFVDESVTATLKPALNKLKIVTETLTLADGIGDYTKLLSNKMIEMDKATRGDASERPGVLSVKGVTPGMSVDLCKAAVDMFRAQPWKKIPEHIALEMRLPGSDDDSNYRERYYVTVLGSDGQVEGFAVMPSLTNLREKYRRAIMSKTESAPESSDDEDRDENGLDDTSENDCDKVGDEGQGQGHAVSKTMDDILLCGACGKRVGESVALDGSKFVDRCGGCHRLLYCGERCQKLDWRARHRTECQQATTDADYVFKRDEWGWLQRELALLFLDPTSIPFDDLDASEKYKWEFIKEASPPLYPLPFVTVQGSTISSNRMDRPTAKEFGFMILIAKALTECVSPPPNEGTLHLASGVSISLAENLAESIHAPLRKSR